MSREGRLDSRKNQSNVSVLEHEKSKENREMVESLNKTKSMKVAQQLDSLHQEHSRRRKSKSKNRFNC